MRRALDAPTGALDEHEQNFVANIRAHGWLGTSVFPDDEGPGFTYTTGFWFTLGCPEVILFSIKRESAHHILWELYRDTKARGQLPIGKHVADVFADGGAYFFPVGVDGSTPGMIFRAFNSSGVTLERCSLGNRDLKNASGLINLTCHRMVGLST